MEDIDTWDGLNAVVVRASEEECVGLLKTELKGKRRPTFLLRIHSRLNRVRASRERLELTNTNVKLGSLRWLR